MQLHRLHARQWLPVSLPEAWEFFSNPRNLAALTPAWLAFRVTSDLPARMHPGMIVTYVIRPWGGWPVSWITEITQVIEPRLFVDEQRFGPYRFWHHQHLFQEDGAGVEMIDLVHYALPFGPFGRLVHRLSVQKRLTEIFRYRRDYLVQRFGPDSSAAAA